MKLITCYFRSAPGVREVKWAENTPDIIKTTLQKYNQPNRPAAVSYANRAAVLIKQGKYRDALASAQLAVRADPEYVKGHHREMRSYELVGTVAQAQEKREEMHAFETFINMLPYYGCALLAA